MEKHAFKCCKKFLFTICKWVSAFADRNGNKFKLVVLITYTLRILFQIFHSFWLEEGLYLKLIQSDKSWTGAEVMKCNEIRDFFYASTENREFFLCIYWIDLPMCSMFYWNDFVLFVIAFKWNTSVHSQDQLLDYD